MFSSIKDAILDRTNRSRENQQKDDGDKNGFVVVNRLTAQQAGNASNAEDVPSVDQEMAEHDSDDSSGSGQSTPPVSPTHSQPDDSFRAWRFMQCDLSSLASHNLPFTICHLPGELANDLSQMLR